MDLPYVAMNSKFYATNALRKGTEKEEENEANLSQVVTRKIEKYKSIAKIS